MTVNHERLGPFPPRGIGNDIVFSVKKSGAIQPRNGPKDYENPKNRPGNPFIAYHIGRYHPRIKLFRREIAEFDGSFFQGRAFAMGSLRDFGRLVIADFGIQSCHQHQRIVYVFRDVFAQRLDPEIPESGRDPAEVLAYLSACVEKPGLAPTPPRVMGYIPGGGPFPSAPGDHAPGREDRGVGIRRRCHNSDGGGCLAERR